MALYALFYMFFHMDLDFLSSDIVYLVYVYLFTSMFSVMSGSIAVMAGYIFVESIYGNVKFD